MRYHNLIFDLYGTLVDIHTEEDEIVWEKTALLFRFYGADYTAQTLHRAFHLAMADREAQAGQNYECFPDIPFEQVMTQLFREKGVDRDAEMLGVQAAQLFRICSIEYLRLYPRVLEALELLRESGYRLWLLSNAQQVFTAFELTALGLGPQLDGVFLSSDYGCRKPDPRFYRAVLEEKGLAAADCLMIGNDRETDIAGARAAGMATLYLHTNLTPSHQAPADPDKAPGTAPADCRDYEYEGWNWTDLVQRITGL